MKIHVSDKCIIFVIFFSIFLFPTCFATVRIMPLGDSITIDDTAGDSRPWSMRTGYRSHLWYALQAGGFDVDFVGSMTAGQAIVPPFDPDNEGHGGWTDSSIANNVYNWLMSNPADIVLLHIGTNCLDESPDDVEDILDEIDRYETNSGNHITVLVARIVNCLTYNPTITAFNDNVEEMAELRILSGDDIIMVDMEDGAGIDYSAEGEMHDYWHPADPAYAKMAALWYSHLEQLLGPPQPPAITSTPPPYAAIGYPYSYDVEATGLPAPVFSLSQYPDGMTIDNVTGLVEWTPTETGIFDVNVIAANSLEPNAAQVFTILVTETPVFALKINCGGPTVVNGDVTWETGSTYVTDGTDFVFSTSTVDTITNSIAESVPPLDVYKAVRHGDHSYSIPQVPNGEYLVRIHWIDQYGPIGARRIDYDIEGVRVEEDWDIVAEAGDTRIAIDKEYVVTVSDSDGMQFVVSKGDGNDAFQSAIEITSLVSVPDVVGMTQTAAESATNATGLTVGTLSTAHSNTVTAGNVISQDPAGDGILAPMGFSVDMVISLGREEFCISGYVENILSEPLEGILVTAENGGGNAMTDSSGYYEVLVPSGWSSNLTAFKEDYTFVPPALALPVTANQVGDFDAQLDADIDNSGNVDLLDLMTLCSYWLTPANLSTGDLDGSGFVDLLDFSEMAEYWL